MSNSSHTDTEHQATVQELNALRGNEERLRLALSASRMGIWDWDLTTNQIEWSDSLERLFGISIGNFTGNYNESLQFVHPDDRALIEQAFQRAVQGDGYFDVSFRAQRPNGGWMWLSVKGEVVFAARDGKHDGQAPVPLRMVGMCADISDYKRLEEAQHLLAEISTALVKTLDHETALNAVMNLVIPTFADYCQIVLIKGRTAVDYISMKHSKPDKEALLWKMGEVAPLDVTAPHGIAQVLRSGQADFYPNVTPEMQSNAGYSPMLRQVIHDLDIQSYMALPLTISGEHQGVIVFGITEGNRHFTPADLELGQEIARRAALAVDKIRLYQASQEIEVQVRQHAQRTQILADVSKTLNEAHLNFHTVTETVVQQVAERLGDGCYLQLLSEDKQSLSTISGYHRDTEVTRLTLTLLQSYPPDVNKTLNGQVVKTGQAMLMPVIDQQQIRRMTRPEYRYYFDRMGMYSMIVVPIRIHNEIIGTLTVVRTSPNSPYTQDDLILLQELADRTGITLENTRLFQEAQLAQQLAEQAAERMARLQQITANLTKPLAPSDIAKAVVDGCIDLMNARGGLVSLVTEDKETLVIIQQSGYTKEALQAWDQMSIHTALPLADVVRSGIPYFVESKEMLETDYPVLVNQGMSQSWVIVPLYANGEVFGGMVLAFEEMRTFSQDDRAFVLSLGHQCAQALERSRLYTAEKLARANAEEALRARNEFLSVAAHELRTPITTLRGFSQMITRQLETTDTINPVRVKQAMDAINKQSIRLATLIGHLLDISRIDSGRLKLECETMNLSEMLTELCRRMQTMTAKHEIVLSVPDGITIYADPMRIEQVFTNLIDNAIKYSPNGGKVRVVLEAITADQVRVSVTDNGIGILPEYRARLFERFFQAQTITTQGMGLGLYISKEIIELHGGTIESEFPDEGGTRFVITLPRGEGK